MRTDYLAAMPYVPRAIPVSHPGPKRSPHSVERFGEAPLLDPDFDLGVELDVREAYQGRGERE